MEEGAEMKEMRAGTHSDRSKDPLSPFDRNGSECPLLVSLREPYCPRRNASRGGPERRRLVGGEGGALLGPQQDT